MVLFERPVRLGVRIIEPDVVTTIFRQGLLPPSSSLNLGKLHQLRGNVHEISMKYPDKRIETFGGMAQTP